MKDTLPFIQYGQNTPLPKAIELHAGQMQMILEDGFLRYIKVGKLEVLRMINHAIRDHNWATIPFSILQQKVEQKENAFHVEYTATAQERNIHFEWTCEIKGNADHSLEFRILGTARRPFRRNRLGFTVLHPVKECTGKPVWITHSDGSREQQTFPDTISPHQPFFDIRAMEWPVGDRGNARLEFFGDIFETEDQRNWIDDSFKTYCTPLGKPFPVQLNEGDTVQQRIRLSFHPFKVLPTEEHKAAPIRFSMGSTSRKLPKIGVGQSREPLELTEVLISRLRKVNFDHLQVDLKLYEPDWEKHWERIIQEAEQLDLPLEVGLFVDQWPSELPAWIKYCQESAAPLIAISIFNRSPHATQAATLEAVPLLRKHFPKVIIGAGTNAFFTELNRDRTPVDEVDYLVYSVNPQVHASDHASIVETLQAIPYTVATASTFAKGRAIHISPITFKMRWNPNATGPEVTQPGRLPFRVDTRQLSLFGAAWTLGAIVSLIRSGCSWATFYETIGWGGIMQAAVERLSDQFPAIAESVYPMYFIFRELLEKKDWDYYPLETNMPLKTSGLGYSAAGSAPTHFIVVNFGAVALPWEPIPEMRGKTTRILDAETFLLLRRDPEHWQTVPGENIENITLLPPFSLLFIA